MPGSCSRMLLGALAMLPLAAIAQDTRYVLVIAIRPAMRNSRRFWTLRIVLDRVGNVWQWTDEYPDEHTRFAILRGGSYYQPQGSMGYFPQACRNDRHGKRLRMSPGRDRAATLGCRCVKDAQ